MYTDLSYAANEELRKHLGDELFFDIANVSSFRYPFHCKVVGEVTVDKSLAKEPLRAILYGTPSMEEDESNVVEEIYLETDDFTYEELYDKHMELTENPPLFEAKYVSLDPILWDLLPPQILHKGSQYSKYKDSAGAVNYISLGKDVTKVLFAVKTPEEEKTKDEKSIEKAYQEFNSTDGDIAATNIGTEISCLLSLLEIPALKKLTIEHIKLVSFFFSKDMLSLVHDEE